MVERVGYGDRTPRCNIENIEQFALRFRAVLGDEKVCASKISLLKVCIREACASNSRGAENRFAEFRPSEIQISDAECQTFCYG
jgi:hypothetical protein